MKQVTWVPTFSGNHVSLLDPRVETIDIKDIARGLSSQPRYNGQTEPPYSIAQHCVLVAEHCPDALKIHGLLHDAEEAYVGHTVRPYKQFSVDRSIGGIADLIAYKLRRCVYATLKIDYPTEQEWWAVKHVHDRVWFTEIVALFPDDDPNEWSADRMAGDSYPCKDFHVWGRRKAYARWLATLYELLGRIEGQKLETSDG